MFNPYSQNTQYYPQMMSNQTMQYMKQEVIKVHGEDGAKAYQLAPNSSVLLLDDISPIVWLKQTDGGGFATLTPYSITPYQKQPTIDVVSLEERIRILEEKINESNTTNAKRTKSNEQHNGTD